jgi:hypothetical protein
MAFAALPHSQQVAWIVNQANTVPIPLGNSYLQTYPFLLNGIKSLMPLNQDRLLIAGSSIFSWMPTQSKINTTLLPSSLAIITNLKTHPLTKAYVLQLANTFQTIRGSSVVAASKLIHFLYPDEYPIWDSRVRQNYGHAPKTDHQSDIYMSYTATVKYLKSDLQVQTACANLNIRINAAGYPGSLTITRLIELCLFL